METFDLTPLSSLGREIRGGPAAANMGNAVSPVKSLPVGPGATPVHNDA
jgi:hypothetical protein